MSKNKIAIIEDEIELLNLLKMTCEGLDCEVFAFRTYEDFIFKFNDIHPDLVITDRNLPGQNGIEVISKIRQQDSDLPIIMISGSDSDDNILEALKNGADDFIAKPFDFEILSVKVIRILSKKSKTQGGRSNSGAEVLDDLKIVRKAGVEIRMTPSEFLIFKKLDEMFDRLVLRNDLLSDESLQSLDVHMHSLRKKLTSIGLEVKTVKGKGYSLTF